MRGEMHLVFQPVFELAGMEVVAVEALMRWTSPRFGEVSPTEFIPIAEDSGAIVPLGAWMLRESCETLARVTARDAAAAGARRQRVGAPGVQARASRNRFTRRSPMPNSRPSC